MAGIHQGTAHGIVVAQQQVVHCFSFLHSAAFWKEQRPLSLWKIIESNGAEKNYVSFNNMRMHGTWWMTINPHGLVDTLNIKFHWQANEQKARMHEFRLVQSTNSWVCRPRDCANADWTQWLIAVTKVPDAMPAAAGLGGPPDQVVHWRTFVHSPADFSENRVLSLWKSVDANGQMKNSVTFGGCQMHGQWELIRNQVTGNVERLMIKFQYEADEGRAEWHVFTPEPSTNSWVCYRHPARSSMWLIAVAHVEEVM